MGMSREQEAEEREEILEQTRRDYLDALDQDDRKLRDKFAAAALPVILQSFLPTLSRREDLPWRAEVAAECYKIADALLLEGNR